MTGTVHLTLAANSERRAPGGRGDRARQLLDAITRVQAASGAAHDVSRPPPGVVS
jgi:hypothetical protein